MKNIMKSGIVLTTLAAAPAFAGYSIDINEDHKLTLGGYFKADLRTVQGDIAYRDHWVGNNVFKPDTDETRLLVRESRFNIKYQFQNITGFLEWDFYDDQQPVGTTETVTGGHSLRLRHAFIQSGNWKVGQTWSTFMPLVSIAESLDFGGPHVAQTFVRQTQVRYTNGGLEVAIENPSTQSGVSQKTPDLVGRYTFKGDWGQVAVAGLLRNLENDGDITKADGAQFAYNVHGRIKTFGKDDFRFSYNAGRPGRYVGPGSNISDGAIDGDIYDITAFTVAYRHFWTEDLRSNLYYGSLEIDDTGADRQHIAVNVMKSINPKTTVGVEIGNYETESGDSDYLQFSVKYAL